MNERTRMILTIALVLMEKTEWITPDSAEFQLDWIQQYFSATSN